MDPQSTPDYGFIGGNHFYIIEAGAPAHAPTVPTGVWGANTKWLADAAVIVEGVGTSRWGGTLSDTTV